LRNWTRELININRVILNFAARKPNSNYRADAVQKLLFPLRDLRIMRLDLTACNMALNLS